MGANMWMYCYCLWTCNNLSAKLLGAKEDLNYEIKMNLDKIICLGKNYLDHAKELGDAIPEKPVLFLKPPSCAVELKPGVPVWFPDFESEVHHECEVVLRLKKGGFRMSIEEARQSIDAVTLGLDMTLRDFQTRQKSKGLPWEIAKAFPSSALLAPWIDIEKFSNFEIVPFQFELDGKVRQKGIASDMRMNVFECIRYASQSFQLCAGDLIFTGTPAGVGPVRKGSRGLLKWASYLETEVTWM